MKEDKQEVENDEGGGDEELESYDVQDIFEDETDSREGNENEDAQEGYVDDGYWQDLVADETSSDELKERDNALFGPEDYANRFDNVTEPVDGNVEPDPEDSTGHGALGERDGEVTSGDTEGTEELEKVPDYVSENDINDYVGDDELAETETERLVSESKEGLAEFEGKDGYVVHESYWVNKPYAYIAILYSDRQNDYQYYVVEPNLDDFEQNLRNELESYLRDVLMYEKIDGDIDEELILEDKVDRLIESYGIDVTPSSLDKILYYLKRDYIYDGKIDPIMRDPAIEDVSCDGDNTPIFVYHRDYRDLMSNVEFEKDELDSFVIKLAQKAGKHISVADPLVDASMPDGSRIQMTLGKEVTDRGSTFTIRLFQDEPFTPIDLIDYNTFSLEQMTYLWTCIENNKSLIFAGGTASGKTTSMNAVTLFIPPKSKVVSIEDTREITLPHMNWIPSVTRDSFSDDGSGEVDMYELLRAALRQRPEYLVVGEVRGEEALTLFQAMSTGHTTYSTMHADSVDSAIHRLENPPISVPRSMLKALDIVSIQSQTFVGGERVRRNMKLVEIIGIDPKTRNIRTDDIFQWNAETDTFVRTGNSRALQDIKQSRGWTDEELERELDKRREVLQYMLDNEITDYEDVSKIIQSFIMDPDRVLEQIENGGIDVDALEDMETLNL